jgi:hypothetical protein
MLLNNKSRSGPVMRSGEMIENFLVTVFLSIFSPYQRLPPLLAI